LPVLVVPSASRGGLIDHVSLTAKSISRSGSSSAGLIMIFYVVITRDRQPGSFRWCVRTGVNQPNELGLSRAEKHGNHAKRTVERLFGPLQWMTAQEAGVDERNSYVHWVARVETKEPDFH